MHGEMALGIAAAAGILVDSEETSEMGISYIKLHSGYGGTRPPTPLPLGACSLATVIRRQGEI